MATPATAARRKRGDRGSGSSCLELDGNVKVQLVVGGRQVQGLGERLLGFKQLVGTTMPCTGKEDHCLCTKISGPQ